MPHRSIIASENESRDSSRVRSSPKCIEKPPKSRFSLSDHNCGSAGLHKNMLRKERGVVASYDEEYPWNSFLDEPAEFPHGSPPDCPAGNADDIGTKLPGSCNNIPDPRKATIDEKGVMTCIPGHCP
jgi:hypothetical protein